MTIQITSLQQGLAISNIRFRQLLDLRVNGRGVGDPYLAGGWLRDIDNGVQPKDMDFYLHAPNVDRALGFVAAYAEVTGHTFKRLGLIEGEDTGYPIGLTVFESETVPEDDFPINLIWAIGTDHPAFDLGICEIYQYHPDDEQPYRPASYKQDIESKTITVVRWQSFTRLLGDALAAPTEDWMVTSAQRIVNHLVRIKEKYPQHIVKVGENALGVSNRWGPDHVQRQALLGYNMLIQGGHIGNPRPVLSTQGPELEGDDVGQQDREEDLGGIEAATARRQHGNQEWLDRAIETARGALRNRTQVQTGLNGAAADLAIFDDPAAVAEDFRIDPPQLPRWNPAPAPLWAEPPVPPEWAQPPVPAPAANLFN